MGNVSQYIRLQVRETWRYTHQGRATFHFSRVFVVWRTYKKISFCSYSHLHKMWYNIGSRSQRQLKYFTKGTGTITWNELNHSNCRARLCPNSIIFACGDCVRRNETPHYAIIMEAGSLFFNQSVRLIRRGYSRISL